MVLTNDDIEHNKVTIIQLLEETNRDNICELIEYMCGAECGFFTAPASGRYHLNCTGGLAQHVLNVYECATLLNNKFGLIDQSSVKIIALLHDFDKSIGYYTPKYLKDGVTFAATPYKTNDTLPLGHGEKSVMLLQRYIKLTPQEMMCIRWHMGTYDRTFSTYESKIKTEFPECLMIFFADYMATLYLESKK